MKLKLYVTMMVVMLGFLTPSYAAFPVVSENQTETLTNGTENSSELVTPAAAASGKSQIVATLLCFFAGIIGIHRFYLGYTWQGIVQILTLGGLGIWAFIDLIRIVIGTLQPKNGSYDKTF
ncbi:TM2 domain-containing protein [Flavobacterium sp.]|uniref:TM2 domain-containing protein n=1 Tax=Flavobacterium sp. TaxID=239 RepID=UPI003528F1DA